MDRSNAAPESGAPHQTARLAGELQILKWAAGIAVVAILGSIGVLYQEIGALRQEIGTLRGDVQGWRTETGERLARVEARLDGIQRAPLSSLGDETH